MYSTDNIIITQLFGPQQVTPYNIAFKYFNLIPMLMGIIMMPFWSAYTEAWVKNDLEWIKKTINKLRFVWVAMTLLSIIMLIFSDFIYWLWVGPEIKVPRSVSICLAIYVIIIAWTSIYTSFINGVGKIKLQLYLSVFGMIVNIPLAIFLGKTVGVAGIILSTILLNLVHIVVQPMQTYKLINNTAKGIWNE
jgi:O-antigen/teichoic acid export membrane protein